MENLRDKLAAAALTGLLAQGSYIKEGFVQAAYRYADAMLAERKSGIIPESTTAPQSKTALQWFADAHAQGVPWAIDAIKYHLERGENWVDGYATLRDALYNAFDWLENDAWEKIYNGL